MAEPARSGRPRDESIDACVLDAALTELSTKGYSAFSIAAVAEAAGTTRPAIYRRWSGRDALVVDGQGRDGHLEGGIGRELLLQIVARDLPLHGAVAEK